MFARSFIEEDQCMSQASVPFDHDPTVSEIPYQQARHRFWDSHRSLGLKHRLARETNKRRLRKRLPLNVHEIINMINIQPGEALFKDFSAVVPSFVRKVRVEELRYMTPIRLVKKRLFHLEKIQCGQYNEPLYVIEYPDGLNNNPVIRRMDKELYELYNHERARPRPGSVAGIPIHISLPPTQDEFDGTCGYGQTYSAFESKIELNLPRNYHEFNYKTKKMEDAANTPNCKAVSILPPKKLVEQFIQKEINEKTKKKESKEKKNADNELSKRSSESSISTAQSLSQEEDSPPNIFPHTPRFPFRRRRRSVFAFSVRTSSPPAPTPSLSDDESHCASSIRRTNFLDPKIRFNRRNTFCIENEWAFNMPLPAKNGTVPAPFFIRRDYRANRLPIIPSTWVNRCHSEPPVISQTLRYRAAPSADMSWRRRTSSITEVDTANQFPSRRFRRSVVDDDMQRRLSEWRHGVKPDNEVHGVSTNFIPNGRSPAGDMEQYHNEDWEVQRRRPSHKKNDVESKAELKPFRDFGAKGTKSSVYHESWLNPKALTPTKYKKEDKPTTNKRSKKWKKAVDSEEDTGSNSEYSMPVETKAPKKVMSSKGQKEKQKSYVPTKSSTTSLPWRPLAKVNMPQPFPSHTPLFTKSAGLPPAVGNTASKSKDETKKDDKTFTSLTTTVDFDPFGALPGDKEKKKRKKKDKSVAAPPKKATKSPLVIKPERIQTAKKIKEEPKFELDLRDYEKPSPQPSVSSIFSNRYSQTSRSAPSVTIPMGRVGLLPMKKKPATKIKNTAQFYDPCFCRPPVHFGRIPEEEEGMSSDDQIDPFFRNRESLMKGSRYYCGRMSAPKVTMEDSYPMVGAANHLYGMPNDLQTELSCVTCDRLPTLTTSQMFKEVKSLAKRLGLKGALSEDEKEYLVKLVQLERAIKIRAMNNSNNTPFVGEQLYAINRRYLEALHNYYMVMGSHETQKQQGYPWVHKSYTQYMNFLNAGIKAMEFSPLNPSRGGCFGKSSSHDGGHSAGKWCSALDKRNFYMYSPGTEVFSRKVFVGGVPSDIDEESLLTAFRHFGKLSADWPNRSEFRNTSNSAKSRSGYVFIVYEKEQSVHALRDACIVEDDQYFMEVLNVLQQPKLVQVRPWMLAEADYVVQPFIHINLRSAIFIGGVPRPIRAVELAHMIDELYGNVVMAGIDTDLPLKYPKGAGRVVFSDFQSYMRAITDKYVRLQHGDIDKIVEIKPYVLDDQPCDECRGQLTDEKAAPFFCPHPDCLQYYCENCWGILHRSDHRASHRPLIKEA